MDILYIPETRLRRYFVLFRNTRMPSWWTRFTVPGTEHCSVVEDAKYPEEGLISTEYCVHMDACYGLLSSQVHWESAIKFVSKALIRRDFTLVAIVEVEKKYRRGYIPFGLWTCVTAVKATLGIHDWRIQTPQKLLRYLEHRGATVVRSV